MNIYYNQRYPIEQHMYNVFVWQYIWQVPILNDAKRNKKKESKPLLKVLQWKQRGSLIHNEMYIGCMWNKSSIEKSISMNHVVDLLPFLRYLFCGRCLCVCVILHIVSINCIMARVMKKIATVSALSLSNDLIV